MDKYQKTFETWNKVALLYQDKFMDLDLYNDSYQFICDVISKDKPQLLEIGCGPGNISKFLLTKRPDFALYGIDIAPNMIALAQKNNPTANFDIMDCRNIASLQTSFDAIIGGFCLPYLSQTDSEKLIADAFRLLNEDGIIYLSFVEGEPSQSDFQVGSSGDSVFFYFHELATLKKVLIENHFEELKTFKVPYKKSEDIADIHTILIAKKKAFF